MTEPLYVKWPNDIICAQKKIAGTIIEIQAETNGICHVIIGIGINVNMQIYHEDNINQQWTSICQANKNNYQDRNPLCAELINQLRDYLARYHEHRISVFLDEWRDRDYLLNKPIELHSNEKKYSGISAGITEQGHLILNLANDEQKIFSSGDTTLHSSRF